MAFDLDAAKTFVMSADLKGVPRGMLSQDAASDAGDAFNQAKNQAQVVGSTLFSFAQGVDDAVREAISDSALLAQLVANKKTSAQAQPLDWYNAYGEVLENVGWTLQEGSWTDYTADGTAAEVNEKIIEVVTAALAPAAGALAIITASVKALQAMNPSSPWITIFSRESQHAKIARFQVGLVEKNPADEVFVSLLACLIEADNTITQILFFKFRDAHARFRANSAKISINRASLGALGPVIRQKVRAWQGDYVSGVLDLAP